MSPRLLAPALALAGVLAVPGVAAGQAPAVPVPVPLPVTLLPPGGEPSPGSPAPAPPPPAKRGCRAAWVMPIGSPGRGVSTSALGPARWAYEVGLPAGRWRGRPPRGLMFLIHGGGWYIVGPGPLSTERADADRWRRRGWLTINIDYPACGRSLAGVLWFHDRVRARYGRRLPLCASGASAGAHLALMMAARRPDVACVVGLGTPTDLRTLARDAAAGGSREGSRAVFDLGRYAFGARHLTAMSPVAQAAKLRARVLLALARRDSVIPLSQAPALRRAILRRRPRAYVQSMILAPGRIPWIHAPVTAAALRRLYAAELRLVAPLLRR
ncbi:MAG: hypothetical protein QOJ97_1003 [Solirubrobacteraceae bacterium]|nr:hypothetical protein [Solirubrobacteraceae bacterium]